VASVQLRSALSRWKTNLLLFRPKVAQTLVCETRCAACECQADETCLEEDM
jgi:hypothetical protein